MTRFGRHFSRQNRADASTSTSWSHAPITTVASFALGFAIFKLVGWRESLGTTESVRFVASVGWVTWKVTAAITATLWVFLFALGGRSVLHETRNNRRQLMLYIAAAIALGAMTYFVATSAVASARQFDVAIPVYLHRVRVGGLVPVGIASALPWIMLVWVAYARSAAVRRMSSAFAAPKKDFGRAVNELRSIWELLSSCVVAFALIVAAGILSTGALEYARLRHLQPLATSNASTADVLLYGAFFAAALTGITLPLIRAWQRSADAFVESVYPVPREGGVDVDWEDGRERLQRLLRLDTSPLRNPLTALSFFGPLATATLATFVPQLANA